MKTNLKNRPQGVKDCTSTSEYYMKAQRWFEDFEKELRESCGWDKLAHWKRSKIPLACSRAFARTCKEKLLEMTKDDCAKG